MKMIRHMSMNIAGIIRNTGKRSMLGLLQDETGRYLTDAEVRLYFAECQDKGWKKLPLGDCEGFDHFEKGCPGHPVIK